jgi:hypothetical protein
MRYGGPELGSGELTEHAWDGKHEVLTGFTNH